MPDILIALIALHFLGDYYLQPKKLADYKDKNLWGVIVHSVLYAAPACISLLCIEGNQYMLWVGVMCGAHFLIDFIKFFIPPIWYSPKNHANENHNGRHLLRVDVRYFADQFLHMLTLSAIAIFFLRSNPDISMRQSILQVMQIRSESLVLYVKAAAAFIMVLQPVNLTFYKIFNIDVLADSKNPENNNTKSVDVKGAGAIIGFMERIIMLCLLIMGQYMVIGFVIAGKSIIRINSNVKQEFFIIGTFYGIITTILTYIVFFKI